MIKISVLCVLIGMLCPTNLFAINPVTANAPQYIQAINDSILEILTENQSAGYKINVNSDGSVKDNNLRPNALFDAIKVEFKDITSWDYDLEELKKTTLAKNITHIMVSLVVAGRRVVARHQDAINKDDQQGFVPRKFIPAVFGRLTGERLHEKVGVSIKQTTLGKNGFKARNEYNHPDDFEHDTLSRFESKGWQIGDAERGVAKRIGDNFRYVKPIYIQPACLKCHGDPIGETSVYGHKKEGYKVGEVRGGISIVVPLN